MTSELLVFKTLLQWLLTIIVIFSILIGFMIIGLNYGLLNAMQSIIVAKINSSSPYKVKINKKLHIKIFPWKQSKIKVSGFSISQNSNTYYIDSIAFNFSLKDYILNSRYVINNCILDGVSIDYKLGKKAQDSYNNKRITHVNENFLPQIPELIVRNLKINNGMVMVHNNKKLYHLKKFNLRAKLNKRLLVKGQAVLNNEPLAINIAVGDFMRHNKMQLSIRSQKDYLQFTGQYNESQDILIGKFDAQFLPIGLDEATIKSLHVNDDTKLIANANMNIKGLVKANKYKLNIDSFSLNFGKQSLSMDGALTYAKIKSKPAIVGKINLQKLVIYNKPADKNQKQDLLKFLFNSDSEYSKSQKFNLEDHYLAYEKSSQIPERQYDWSDKKIGAIKLLRQLYIKLKINLKQIIYNQRLSHNSFISIVNNTKKFRMNSKLIIGKTIGKLELTGGVNNKNAITNGKIKAQFSISDMEEWLKDSFNSGYIMGILTGKMSLQFAGNSVWSMMEKLSGNLQTNLQNGKIVGYNLRALQQNTSLLTFLTKSNNRHKNIIDMFKDDKSYTPVNQLICNISLKNGIGNINKAILDAIGLKLGVNKGIIDLTKGGADIYGSIWLSRLNKSGNAIKSRFNGPFEDLELGLERGSMKAFTTSLITQTPGVANLSKVINQNLKKNKAAKKIVDGLLGNIFK